MRSQYTFGVVHRQKAWSSQEYPIFLLLRRSDSMMSQTIHAEKPRCITEPEKARSRSRAKDVCHTQPGSPATTATSNQPKFSRGFRGTQSCAQTSRLDYHSQPKLQTLTTGSAGTLFHSFAHLRSWVRTCVVLAETKESPRTAS